MLTLFLAFPAKAKDQDNPLHPLGMYLARHGYGAVDFGHSFLTAKINGKDSFLLVQTAVPSVLSFDLASKIPLEMRDSGQKYWWLAGPLEYNSEIGALKSFTVNTYEINRTSTILVLPSKGEAKDTRNGILGFDFLHLNDAILCLNERLLFFKPGSGPSAPVGNYLEALGLKPIPMTYGDTGLTIPGKLDGHPFNAHVSSSTFLSEFDRDYLNAMEEPTYKTYIQLRTDQGFVTGFYRIHPTNLMFGPITIAPMYIGAFQTPFFNHFGCNMLLGEDIMLQHHAVIDFGSNTLWMK